MYSPLQNSMFSIYQNELRLTIIQAFRFTSLDVFLLAANCVCPCDKVHEVKNYTSEELSKLIEELKKELTVNKAVLSATIRKKISVMDYRPSAKSIGSVGAVLITLIFVLLIGFDIPLLKEHLTKLFKGPRNPL